MVPWNLQNLYRNNLRIYRDILHTAITVIVITVCRNDRCVSIFLQSFTHEENAICKAPATKKKSRLVSSTLDEQVFQAGMKITGALQKEVYHFLYSSI